MLGPAPALQSVFLDLRYNAVGPVGAEALARFAEAPRPGLGAPPRHVGAHIQLLKQCSLLGEVCPKGTPKCVIVVSVP